MAKTSESVREFTDYDETAVRGYRDAIDEAEAKETFVPKEGRNIVRFLPAPADAGHPALLKTWRHGVEIFDPGAKDKKRYISFVCPKTVSRGEKRCPHCEYIAKMEVMNAVDGEALYRQKPRRQVYGNVLVKMHGDRAIEPDKQLVQVYRFTQTVDDKLDGIVTDYGSPTNLRTGYDMVVTRPPGTKGEKDDIKPLMMGGGNKVVTPLDPAGAWVKQLYNLSKYAAVLGYDEICAKLGSNSDMDRIGPGDNRNRAALPPAPRRPTVTDDIAKGAVDDDEDI